MYLLWLGEVTYGWGGCDFFVGGCGCLQLILVGYDQVWLDVAGCGWMWLDVVGCGWVWLNMVGCG